MESIGDLRAVRKSVVTLIESTNSRFRDPQESDTLARLAEQDLNTTAAEDVRLVESMQRGLESGGYRPGPLVINPEGGVNSEHSIKALYGWLDEAMR